MTDDEEAAPLGGGLPECSGNGPAKEFNWGSLGDILGRVFRGVAFNHVLSKVLAIAAQAEQAVSDVVAMQLGRDEKCMDILADKVLGYVPNDKKLNLLEDMISARGWASEFSEVIPTLRSLQEMRNKLAHSYDADDPDLQRDDKVYRRRTYRRGRETDFQIDAGEIFILTEAAEKILSEDLAEIARRSLPQHHP